MYVCVCMSVYVCLYIYACVCMSEDVCLRMYVCGCMSVDACVWMCVCLWMHVCECTSVDVCACKSTGACRGQKGTSDTLELEVYGTCELCDVGAENQTQIFCKNNTGSSTLVSNFCKKIHHVFNKSCKNLQSCQ